MSGRAKPQADEHGTQGVMARQRGFTTHLPILVIALALASSCGSGRGESSSPVRLVDRFTRDVVSGNPASSPPLSEALAWQFDGDRALGVEPAATWGWGNGPDVADLQVRDGSLTGTVIGDFPILRVERTGDVDERDTLHAIEIRARVSAGENLWLDVNADDETSFEEIAENGRAGTWRMATPLQAGDEMQTYTVTTNQTVSMAAARFVLVRPTDATEADFEIDYIRVVSRREHLASIDSGIGWQGLAEIYHETLVARSPETLSFEVEMPARPWLDLALGSPEEQPVTFHVQVSSGATEPMMSHTITTPHRWERRRIPLDAFAGQTVTVSLSLAAQDDGTIGFWGTPVIRSGAGETGSRAEGALGAAPRGVIYMGVKPTRCVATISTCTATTARRPRPSRAWRTRAPDSVPPMPRPPGPRCRRRRS